MVDEEKDARFLQNSRKPVGHDGELLVERMNAGHHAALAKWGLSHLSPSPDARVLDVGCGGGANLARLLDRCPEGSVTGLDYSEISVRKSLEVNAQAVADGRCSVVLGDVMALPFPDASFDLVTAFETVYFWPDVAGAFREISRVLDEGGTFMVCNESDGRDAAGKKWAGLIDGMTLFTEAQLTGMLEGAGFTSVTADGIPEKGWMNIVARRGQR